MEISLRDERGQGVVEYVLVLVVAVAIILGGIYQLNSAFKAWANNYFGMYLACLLETGELPTIGGNPGDSGVCNTLFQPFSLAEGRPLISGGGVATPPGQTSSSSGGGSREQSAGFRAGAGRGGGGGGGGYRGGGGSSGGRFSSRPTPRRTGARARAGAKSSSVYTGSTGASEYGGGFSSRGRRTNAGVKDRLDTRFALQDEQRETARRGPSGTTLKRDGDAPKEKQAIKVRGQSAKKDKAEEPSSAFTLGNFIRFLIIAAIIIAIVMFLGGQALQIGKSMD